MCVRMCIRPANVQPRQNPSFDRDNEQKIPPVVEDLLMLVIPRKSRSQFSLLMYPGKQNIFLGGH